MSTCHPSFAAQPLADGGQAKRAGVALLEDPKRRQQTQHAIQRRLMAARRDS
jgi:hypothetical protein